MSEDVADHPSPFVPLLAELARMRKSNLSSTIQDVDKIIELLETTRQQIVGGPTPGQPDEGPNQEASEVDAHTVSLAMARLLNPVKEQLTRITNDLKEVTKAQKSFGKALDRAMPVRDLPLEPDLVARHPELVNRAIGMHLLREGQFNVASALYEEAKFLPQDGIFMHPTSLPYDSSDPEQPIIPLPAGVSLQERFTVMYDILGELRNYNLVPAIDWARINHTALEANGSTLEFELNKLQFIWLFKQAIANGESMNSAQETAFNYARKCFSPFQSRHMVEISELSAAMVYSPNIESSPYHHLFSTDVAFEDAAQNFSREFCSLLGLSPESPLHVAVTAGSLALPRLIKFTTRLKAQKAEWSTVNELAFETPLPSSMIYHPIFVCPVSKEQTTDANPPMMLMCGHVISKGSLNSMAKNERYKCPYCPVEGVVKEVPPIKLH